jgi:mannan endo-1,6-alpha-mannosidase
MAALEVIQSLLVEKAHAPKSVDTGGTSTSDPNAGLTDPKSLIQPVEVTGKDRAGAGVLTAVVLLGVCSMFAFMAI